MTHNCAQPFELSPGPATLSPYDYLVQMASPIDLPRQMATADAFNVPFDSAGFNAARSCYSNPCGLPTWPASKMLPVMDRTREQYDVMRPYATTPDVNTYRDNLTRAVTPDPAVWLPDSAGIVNAMTPLVTPPHLTALALPSPSASLSPTPFIAPATAAPFPRPPLPPPVTTQHTTHTTHGTQTTHTTHTTQTKPTTYTAPITTTAHTPTNAIRLRSQENVTDTRNVGEAKKVMGLRGTGTGMGEGERMDGYVDNGGMDKDSGEADNRDNGGDGDNGNGDNGAGGDSGGEYGSRRRWTFPRKNQADKIAIVIGSILAAIALLLIIFFGFARVF